MSPPDFPRYARALAGAGIASPVLMIDRDALDANTTAIGAVPEHSQQLRLVAKSLPVPQLLSRVLTAWGSDRVMTFSVAMLVQIEAALPGRHHLFGKPVPVGAARGLLEECGGTGLSDRVVWLVDTAERVRQYSRLAHEMDTSLQVAVELDVGLHRGGFSADALEQGLREIAVRPGLRFAGLMGYDAHLPALPTLGGVRRRAQRRFESGYRSAVQLAETVFGASAVDEAIRNTAGSKTLADRVASRDFNDFSVGSLLVKPADFDGVGTPEVQPAMFIATPVLKVVDPLRIPGFGSSRAVQRGLAGGARRGLYIHGGHWMAEPVHPEGLGYSSVMGRSSNQELLVTSQSLSVGVDDLVFFRPRQSEALMLQFGPIAVVSGERVVQWWEPFPPSA